MEPNDASLEKFPPTISTQTLIEYRKRVSENNKIAVSILFLRNRYLCAHITVFFNLYAAAAQHTDVLRHNKKIIFWTNKLYTYKCTTES